MIIKPKNGVPSSHQEESTALPKEGLSVLFSENNANQR